MRLVVGILPDVDARGLHPSLLMRAREKVDDDLIGGKRADLLRAADTGGRGDLDEPRRVQLFDVRGDGAVGDVEPLGKIGEIELFIFEQFLQNAEADIRIERFIQEPSLSEIF